MSQKTAAIFVTSQPSSEQLNQLGVFNWSIWEKEESEFPWTYGDRETCYFLEGDVVVTPDGGEPVTMGKGDLVTFPEGMPCTWKINKAVKKHYKFG
ncbi:cupin domain-containing protein [Pleurocapsa sp. PCC 7319]|uniref:cupin domain-containing protein n=1 Tax=Pleurocapsa sp. PCC 7319 TaxID=118161 RepID=UPI000346D5E6|nr:cupin domain-containing protein [Pleurocapsa sp. PCC 7319]